MIAETVLQRAMDEAARALSAASPFFTERNLYHEALRGLAVGPDELPFGVFRARLRGRRGRRIPGLLVARRAVAGRQLPKEFDAYFPSGVLLVDRASVLDLLVALGVHVHARIAVVCIDGSPKPVVDWLCRGLRRGWRAPFGFLHDAGTVVYPYLIEPLATFVEVAGTELSYADLGFPSGGHGVRTSALVNARRRAPEPTRYMELEEIPPLTLAAYAVSRLQRMLPGDPMMAPVTTATDKTARERASERIR